MANMRDVTPFLRVPDIQAAVKFFVDILGFKIGFEGGGYAYVWRDKVAFRLIQDDELPPRGDGRYTSYVDVEDVDALYAELRPKLAKLPADHVTPPCDMDYGQREFTVVGPDGDLIAFGMGIPAKD
jgi:catechol 2,3-dioxygenase-like lactoylglutathione lyase family enzyme